MKTTLIIDDGIMARLKQEAARRRKRLSELVESALRLYLDHSKEKRDLPPLPLLKTGSCLVDISDRDALYRAMEGD